MCQQKSDLLSCRAIVMGGSAGGVEVLRVVLSELPPGFGPAVLLVQHLHRFDRGAFSRQLAHSTTLPVIEPCDKQPIAGGTVYAAPADYHMHVEKDETISLSVDPKVNWSRPSIDVLFDSAARVWEDALVAVILSGANGDGTAGMRAVKAAGGRTIAQEPSTAVAPYMPQAAIEAGVTDDVLPIARIGARLLELGEKKWKRLQPDAAMHSL